MDNVETFIEKFNEAVDFQEPVAVTAETRLESLPEWDSLAALGVIVMFDMEYGKTITGEHLAKAETIQDLYQLLG
ncbi:acyl carrier protein [Oxalicibacterium flavum]|uniref:Acyl carrier protein n=1 Tax=Oxalicibacterium flavum TaxID=179467 RepID=A0A8J2ULR9_9BURK|nr:acyl carrier protein [Oxalicibacterium flavum]GGC14603.1 acyl carrier protein [Oxalicibacterium flavum]